jgi:hypothetical protein
MTNVAGNVNVGNMNAGHTPKRSIVENPRTSVPQSTPGGFMRDARRTYENSGIPTHRPAQQTVMVETDIRRKRKVVEENVFVDSDEDEVSLNTQIQNLGYASRLVDQVEATPSKVVDGSGKDSAHYQKYLDFLKRPRITTGAQVDLNNEGSTEITYEEFLKQLLWTDTNKKVLCLRQMERENIVPIIESPVKE